MLTIWKSILLGAVQGATEFLPVSSSGHLVVFQQLFGWTAANETILAFDLALHVGTLISVLIVFRKEIIEILTGKSWNLFWMLIIATIPAVIVGLLFKNQIEGLFSSVLAVGVAWIVTGVVLILTEFYPNKVIPAEAGIQQQAISWWKALVIGFAQAIAIIPGISRSGSTIAAGIFCNIDKVKAARFAFLMSVPAIAGGAVLDLKNLTSFQGESVLSIIAGIFSAAVVGYLCIKWLLQIIGSGKLWYFGVYCFVAGIAALVVMNLT